MKQVLVVDGIVKYLPDNFICGRIVIIEIKFFQKQIT